MSCLHTTDARDDVPLPFGRDDFNEQEEEAILAWLTESHSGYGLTPHSVDARQYDSTADAPDRIEEILHDVPTGEPIPLNDEMWHTRAGSASDYYNQRFKDLWISARALFFQYLELEEIYSSMSPLEKKDEVFFASMLNRVSFRCSSQKL